MLKKKQWSRHQIWLHWHNVHTKETAAFYTTEKKRRREKEWEWDSGSVNTYMCFLAGCTAPDEGIWETVLSMSVLCVTGFLIALKLTGAPAVVQRAAAALLPELNIIIDHLIWVWHAHSFHILQKNSPNSFPVISHNSRAVSHMTLSYCWEGKFYSQFSFHSHFHSQAAVEGDLQIQFWIYQLIWIWI